MISFDTISADLQAVALSSRYTAINILQQTLPHKTTRQIPHTHEPRHKTLTPWP